MTVVINELEVVVPSERGEAPAAAPPPEAAPPPPSPREIAEVLERRARIALRTLAH
jgi:hypothetical protein